MKTTGNLEKVTLDFETKKAKVILELNTNDIEYLNKLNGENLDIEIKKKTKHRSLNSNNYAWHLITEIGNLLLLDKEDVYFKMLKKYGQSDMISVLSEIDIGRFLKYYEKARRINFKRKKNSRIIKFILVHQNTIQSKCRYF